MGKVGRYRIQAVADMTGIPAATLRAWERRYGVPAPARTDASYRLYSEGDVELVRKLRDLCAKGVAPAEAAQLVLEAPVDGTDPDDGRRDPPQRPSLVHRRRILDALRRLDAAALERETRAALLLGPAAVVFDHVLEPLLHDVGVAWERGELSVAQEHLLSETLGNLARELWRLAQPTDSLRLATLACVADETHVIALYAVGFRLAQWGFRSVILGARTPPRALEEAVDQLDPTLVGLSVTVGPPDAAELFAAYGRACGDTPWIVGGQSAERCRRQIEQQGGLVAPGDTADLYARLTKASNGRNGNGKRRGRG